MRLSTDGTAAITTDRTRPHPYQHRQYAPSSRWQEAGPIIEREQMCIQCPDVFQREIGCGVWSANVHGSGGRWQDGKTLLIAAMRAYVASRFGDEVELP